MRIQLMVQFYLKDRPKGYRGMTQESWNFGKTRPATMADLAIGFLKVLFDWHRRFLSLEDINKETVTIYEWLSQVAFTEQIELAGGADEQ